MQKKLVFVGAYTANLGFVDGKGKGIAAYWFDPLTGGLEHAATLEGQENPSFLVVHPDGKHLYAVNETAQFRGMKGGAVSALEFDRSTGSLKLLNQQPSFGAAPCHISLDRSGKYALVANYSSGSLAVYPLQPDGSLGEATDLVQHSGKGPDPNRQEGPHAHFILTDPTNAFALACDLGLDQVLVYRFDLESGRLFPHDEPFASLHPGAGPRHLAFHPGGKYVYVINELDATLTGFAWDGKKGSLRTIETVSTLPEGVAGPKSCAEIQVHPNGRFVYGSNRRHDSIVIFRIDEGSGRLTLVGHESTQGKTPRFFCFDPAGKFLLAANQDSSTVVTFRLDAETGKLTATGVKAEVPTPVCLAFAA